MQGRAYLDVARTLLKAGAGEAFWRGASGRAYYGLFLECRDALARWGFIPKPRDAVHSFVRLRCDFGADPDLKAIGNALGLLGRLRNQADYDLTALAVFASDVAAAKAVANATAALATLDAIEADPAHRAAAIAAIRTAFP